ncbi:MAG TPA: hypothetical protein VJA46_14455 [Acidimicrobiia bacterium]|nr:hypothetical protein [Acidimicrobiia bacterium]
MKTHSFDTVSFVSGLVSILVGLLFLIAETPEQIVDVLVNSGAWVWPVALLIVGLAVIIPVLMPKKDEALESGDSD